ncbi:hypothetical protein [Pseudaminobacter soli (ex Li et al. 2025)]|uniref:CD-NTase-associated protein 12/Pycsar effector protein TIR domain-containing protein n=1 Tax=Pseudaminobacter soli (ex Li et al. 2025) TaxID=1295366 RepID=A0A2P7S9S8_9HYPH|nr:hypothetical protein [Mesorhizobium soli]PSJ59242.1 hypothetical protein C7I85_16605 [Mesorhizobium soli]
MLAFLDDRQKARLTSWLVDQHQAGSEWPLVTSTEVENAKSAPPLTLTERRDRLLKMVSEQTPTLGKGMRYYAQVIAISPGAPPPANSHWANHDALLAATESIEIREVKALIKFAREQGLLVDDTGGLSLTFDGHTHLEKLRERPRNSHQAFVAMWFGPEVAAAYEEAIAPAIVDSGYRPIRIDQKEHNNKIDDEIIAEIRRSRFVVADFTCGLVGEGQDKTAVPRGGVYYEAGYAQGLGIPVIWTCREDHINHVHFDTRQFNHITWRTPAELRSKLRNRIGAVLGDGPLK